MSTSITSTSPSLDNPTPQAAGVHPFAWHTRDELAELPMFEDTKLLSEILFSFIDGIAAEEADSIGLLPFAAG